MAFDYKKEYKDLYLPQTEPRIIEVPKMTFIMVDGQGDPNQNPSYLEAIEILYAISYTVKMSKMGNQPQGYFDFVVPPLEGLWTISDGVFRFDNRENWVWTSMIRQPEFVTQEVFDWAIEAAKKKKPMLAFERARREEFIEGLCVHALHNGPYATEPETIKKMQAFMDANNLIDDIYGGKRHHHEIYLSDPRKTAPEKRKTILRHPVVKKS